MDIQTIFYLVGTIFMLMFIVSFLFVGYFLWRIERVLRELPANTMNKVRGFVEDHTSGIGGTIGMAVLSYFLNRMKKKFSKEE